MKWIDATNLEQWAGTIQGREEIAELVASLVRASAKSISAYRFPTGSFAQLPGYDGLLEAESSPPWVPGGVSVWEFGTSEDPEKKATKDYKTRKENPRNVTPAATTFIFVTPRVWKGDSRTDWVAERTAESFWKDVRVIDGIDLEAWLGAHDGVASRFATQVLRIMPPPDVRSASDFWDGYAARSKVRLTEKVVIAGRADEVVRVRQALATESGRLVSMPIRETRRWRLCLPQFARATKKRGHS